MNTIRNPAVQLENLWLVGCTYRDIGFANTVLREKLEAVNTRPDRKATKSRGVYYETLLESYSNPEKSILVRLLLKLKPRVQPTCVIELDCVAQFAPVKTDIPTRELVDQAEAIGGPCLLAFAREKLGGLTHMTPYPTVFLPELNLDALMRDAKEVELTHGSGEHEVIRKALPSGTARKSRRRKDSVRDG